VVAWAASNGDRSENADYSTASGGCGRSMGGSRFSRSIEAAEVVDPELRERAGRDEVEGIFGATVRYANAAGIASGELRGHRRNRSRPQPHQLGVTSGRAVDEVAAGDA